MNIRSRYLSTILFASLICLVVGRSQSLPKPIEMLKQFERTFENVQDFTATIEADVDMDRLRIPRMNATVYFKRPDRVQYSAPGFALLPRDGMTLNPVGLREKYIPTLVGRDTVNGTFAVRLDLTPRDAKAKLKAMTLWLDTSTWTPLRMETAPYGGRTIQADFVYETIEGKYLLPTKVTVQFQSPPTDPGVQDSPQSSQHEPSRNAPRSGRISIRYKEYTINAGLSDEVFETPAIEK